MCIGTDCQTKLLSLTNVGIIYYSLQNYALEKKDNQFDTFVVTRVDFNQIRR